MTKGILESKNITCLDLVKGVVVDDLHGVFLGVTLSLLHLWLDKGNRAKPFFIGNNVNN